MVVVEGGSDGTPAAITATKNGADVFIVERSNCLGGTITGGLGSVESGLFQGVSAEECYRSAGVENVTGTLFPQLNSCVFGCYNAFLNPIEHHFHEIRRDHRVATHRADF